MTTFVLVHGACVGGWCWRWLAPHLTAAGHHVITPTLTGLGERSHLASRETTLETHIRDVLAVYVYEDLSDTVLVGHSYGGMVIAGVADRVGDRLRHLVYLDSDVPRDGDTSVPPSQHEERREKARLEDGWRVPPPVDYFRAQLEGMPESTVEWFLQRLAPHPLRTWVEPIRLAGAAETVRTTYIRCTVGHDPTREDPARQDARVRSEPSWRYREVEAPHMAPITHPEVLAALLLEAASLPVDGDGGT